MNFLFLSNRIKSRAGKILSARIKNGLNLNGLSPEDSLQFLLNNNKSLIRWGDGETIIAMGGNLPFQQNTKELREKILTILKSAACENRNFNFAIPWKYLNCPITQSPQAWHHTRYLAAKYLPPDTTCLDAHMFRNDKSLNHSRLPDSQVEKLWQRFKKIILVVGNIEYMEKFKKDYQNLNCILIETPTKNAFTQYNKIIQKIKSNLSSDNTDTCLIAACGPTAKVIVYDLLDSVIAYDLGHYLNHRYGQKQ